MLTEAEQYLANMGYTDYWYSSTPGAEVEWRTLETAVAPFPNYDQSLSTTTPPQAQPTPLPAPPPASGTLVAWPWEGDFWKGWGGGIKDKLEDPLGPIDDIFKFPGDIFEGIKGGIMPIAQMLPLMMMMGGKMDFKKIMLMMLISGGMGALGGIFGGSSSGGTPVAFGEPAESGSLDPMMMAMMMGGGGSSNQMLKTVAFAPMLGIGAGAAMMLGMMTGSDKPRRRSYRRRRSYGGGGSYQAGFNRGLAAGK